MKNKKLVYVLLPLVVLIWGIIVYRIFTSINPDSPNVTGRQSSLVTDTLQKNVPDTFTIVANYRDPFLGALPVAPSKPGFSVTKPVAKAPEPPKETIPVLWPSLSYSGMVRNKDSKKQMALIQINNSMHSMQINETVAGVQLLGIYPDSIIVVFNKQKKTIKI